LVHSTSTEKNASATAAGSEVSTDQPSQPAGAQQAHQRADQRLPAHPPDRAGLAAAGQHERPLLPGLVQLVPGRPQGSLSMASLGLGAGRRVDPLPLLVLQPAIAVGIETPQQTVEVLLPLP